LNAASAVVPHWRSFHSPATFRAEHPKILSQDRAGDGAGKKRNNAQCFGFGHGVFSVCPSERNPLLGRTFRYFKPARRLRSGGTSLPLVQYGFQCWDSAESGAAEHAIAGDG
jgi:hypothetical protein